MNPATAHAWPKVWSRGVRLLHGALAGSVLLCLLGPHGGRLHEWAGYGALACAVLRLGLGLVGPAAWRFASFVQAPGRVMAYGRRVLAGVEERHVGHNPLGGWMILALLGFALVAAGSGALSITDALWGVAWVQDVHELSSEAFFLLVPLHLAGVAFSSWRHRENLVLAMLHGRKRPPVGDDQPPAA
jgi:cytochrome b